MIIWFYHHLKICLRMLPRQQLRLQLILNQEKTKSLQGRSRIILVTVRVPAGKTLNDGELFTTLDYYVEGIKGKIPG